MAAGADDPPRIGDDMAQELRIEIDRALFAGEWRGTLIPKLLARGLPRDLVLRLVDEVETRHREDRERKHNRLAMAVGAFACFFVCWIASFLLRATGAPDKLGELAGGVIGGFFGMIAKDFGLPGLRRGELIGWLAYYASLPVYWAL